MISLPPRCTVVIPTYNCAEYLYAALSSVVAQRVSNLEVIVVDDGSTDATAAVLETARADLPELGALRVLKTKNLGPGAARNFAVAEARAPLIAFLDADDIWLPGKLERQIAFHEAFPKTVLSFTDYRHVGPDGEDRGGCFDFWNHKAAEAFTPLAGAHSILLGRNLVGTSTVMTTSAAFQAVGGFACEMPSSEDWELWLKLARGGAVACSGKIGCDYLMRPNSLTAARERRIAAMETILGRALAAQPAPEARDVRAARARILTARAEFARERGMTFRAMAGHAVALILDPSTRAFRATVADFSRSFLASLGLAGRA